MLQQLFYVLIIVCVVLWITGFFILQLGDLTHLLLAAAIFLLAIKLYNEENVHE